MEEVAITENVLLKFREFGFTNHHEIEIGMDETDEKGMGGWPFRTVTRASTALG